MQAGRFRTRVMLQERTSGFDDLGQPVSTWSDVAPLWADVRSNSGLQTLKADMETSVVKFSIRVRYREGITSAMRFTQGSTVYQIDAVLPDVARRQYVDLVCKVVT